MSTLPISKLWADFTNIFFPDLCIACRNRPPQPSIPICVTCENSLSLTNFHEHEENDLLERFWGRVPIKYGAALFYFQKNSAIQELFHQLKYNNNPKIGVLLGEWYGYELRKSHFMEIDAIIPVPLHPKKLHLRGYNQSDSIAQGLGKALQKPIYTKALVRIENTETQTKKTRMERFDNVKNAFQVNEPNLIKGKHLLIVDDVLTTGATIEACALKLLEIEGVTISIATIAIGQSS